MKAIEINGEIKMFKKLPDVWKDSNGVYSNFGKVSNPEKYGFYDVVTPAYDSVSHQLDNLHFVEGENVFTYDIIEKTFSKTLQEFKELKKQEVKAMAYKLLQPTDWYGIRLAINGIALPKNITDERNEILRKSDVAEVEIDNLMTIPDVIRYEVILVDSIDSAALI